jgi:hypothetical protein
MKYIEALKKYNEGKDKWCFPRKGSEDYLNIIRIMKNIPKKKDKLDLLNVSGRNNNCFFNSIYLIVKDNDDFKKSNSRSSKIERGTYLRKYLCKNFMEKNNIKKTIRKYKTYLELVQFYLNDSMKIEEVSQLLSVNRREIKSLKKANIKNINLNNDIEIQKLLGRHFLVSGRMPSDPEMLLTINYIKKLYNIIVLRIILNSKHGNSSSRDKTLDIINKYNYRKKNIQKYDIDLLTNMKADIKNAGIIGKIRKRIGDKLENTIKSTSSSGSLQNSARHYNYSVIITDNSHYQLLKINRKILSSFDDIREFILNNDNSFSFSQTNISSNSRSSSK